MTALNPGWLRWPETQTLIAAFTMAGQEIRFVGGCVRDALLGIESSDIDAATPATPGQVIALLQHADIGSLPTGIDHGTITARIGNQSFEITTLRRDTENDGRHAVVAYISDWQQDAERRDFTMNALYLSPTGELFDYFNGQADLSARRLRFIGDPAARIREDGLRILRYFRFLAQLGCPAFDATLRPKQLEFPSWQACKELAFMVEGISGERIHQEMFKLLAVPHLTYDIFCWMSEAGVANHLFPDADFSAIESLVTLEHQFSLAADPMRRLCLCLSNDEFSPLERQLSMLRNRWKLSNAEATRLGRFQKHCYELSLASSITQAKRLKRRVGEIMFCDIVLTRWASSIANNNNEAESNAAFAPMMDVAQHWHIPLFPLSGQDLLDSGFAAGKALGQKLKMLEQIWEASGYTLDKPALLALL